MHMSPFIADCLLVFFFHFCHESPVVQGMWIVMREFPLIWEESGFIFLCRKDPGGNTGYHLPLSKYFEKLM